MGMWEQSGFICIFRAWLLESVIWIEFHGTSTCSAIDKRSLTMVERKLWLACNSKFIRRRFSARNHGNV